MFDNNTQKIRIDENFFAIYFQLSPNFRIMLNEEIISTKPGTRQDRYSHKYYLMLYCIFQAIQLEKKNKLETIGKVLVKLLLFAGVIITGKSKRFNTKKNYCNLTRNLQDLYKENFTE